MGIARAEPGDVFGVHRLATDLLGARIASVALLSDMHEHNPDTLFVLRNSTVCEPSERETTKEEAVAGFLAILPLNGAGVDAIWRGSFDPLNVDLSQVCSAGDDPQAIYVWGIGGASLKDRATIWAFARFLETDVFAHLAHFARPGTQRGAELMEQRGFRSLATLRHGAPDWLWMRPALTGSAAPPGV